MIALQHQKARLLPSFGRASPKEGRPERAETLSTSIAADRRLPYLFLIAKRAATSLQQRAGFRRTCQKKGSARLKILRRDLKKRGELMELSLVSGPGDQLRGRSPMRESPDLGKVGLHAKFTHVKWKSCVYFLYFVTKILLIGKKTADTLEKQCIGWVRRS
ncbi:hypothetical protein GM415_03920 [Pseudodesulfovibrio cashew]|uniref:Uncharacterized protein n=1 Tax=Pseudodesulfovibrio cashew TaxID=2678688 RepID=A0A6I6JDZ8_9BACT|nr:hypothetical protein [Pseudodesulfovibrio cashew]QGY39300.1 hypothetical protein GM415_03920 [Pseudodesulfovibrio cashew]